MTYETILYNTADSVATITLNRPERYNAFNETMLRETIEAIKTAGRDTTVRAIVLTGAGKAFSSGQDLKEMQALIQANPDGRVISDHLRSSYNDLVTRMRTVEKPIIGAINGLAAGAGSSVALACDVRICSEQAGFVFAAFVNIGLIPDGGGTFLLPRIVGQARAFELAVLADSQNPVNAQQALTLGLVVKVVAADQMALETEALAHRLAALPTRAIGLTKRAMNRSWDNTLAESLELEAQLQGVVGITSDFKEGIAAFIEKRQPKFRGS